MPWKRAGRPMRRLAAVEDAGGGGAGEGRRSGRESRGKWPNGEGDHSGREELFEKGDRRRCRGIQRSKKTV